MVSTCLQGPFIDESLLPYLVKWLGWLLNWLGWVILFLRDVDSLLLRDGDGAWNALAGLGWGLRAALSLAWLGVDGDEVGNSGSLLDGSLALGLGRLAVDWSSWALSTLGRLGKSEGLSNC